MVESKLHTQDNNHEISESNEIRRLLTFPTEAGRPDDGVISRYMAVLASSRVLFRGWRDGFCRVGSARRSSGSRR
jgi:hypothetical protein